MEFISADELIKMRQKNRNLIVINVLPKESFEKEHIPGSFNFPVSDPKFVEQVKNKFPNREQEIVVHCFSQDCPASTKAAKQLQTAGYKRVYDFKGGIQDWIEAGHELEGFAKPKAK